MTAQANKHCLNTAMDAFRRKYAHKTIVFWATVYEDHAVTVDERVDSIRISDYKLSKLILQIFGPLIESIETRNEHLERDHYKEIVTLICKHCSGLKSIVVDRCRKEQYELELFPSPLKSVINVTLGNSFVTTSSEFKLDRIFPGVRRLELTSLIEIDEFIGDVNLPFLEEVIIKNPFCSGFYPSLESIFKKNPQIHSLALESYNAARYLKMTSELLPNLVEMQTDFRYDTREYDEIYFPKVKKLQTNMGTRDYFEILKFDNLEEISMHCNLNDCLRFIKNNMNVKKVKLDGSLEAKHVIEIGSKLKYLTEFSLTSATPIEANDFIRLINKSKMLNKLELKISGVELFGKLSKQLKGKWNVEKDKDVIFAEKLD